MGGRGLLCVCVGGGSGLRGRQRGGGCGRGCVGGGGAEDGSGSSGLTSSECLAHLLLQSVQETDWAKSQRLEANAVWVAGHQMVALEKRIIKVSLGMRPPPPPSLPPPLRDCFTLRAEVCST